MSNPSKQKGTIWESGGVGWLHGVGFPGAHRITLHGAKDRGDVFVVDTPHGPVKFEMKNCKTIAPTPWLRQADNEKDNAGAWMMPVWFKLPGVGLTDPGRHPVMLRASAFIELLNAYLYEHAENERLKAENAQLRERRFYA